MAELLKGGGLVQLREGAELAFERLPKPFGDLIRDPVGGVITVKAVPIAEPWYMRLEVDSDLAQASIDVDLGPVEPPPDWVSEWRGSKGGFDLVIRTRWSVNQGQGETALACRYRSLPTAPVADRVAALRTMVALHGKGTMRAVDRTGQRTAMEKQTDPRPVQPELMELWALNEALLQIEQFSGKPAPPPPDEIRLAEIDRLRAAAEVLRAGGEMVRLKEATMMGDHTLVQQIQRSFSEITVSDKAFIKVFGQEVEVGERVISLPLMKIKEARRRG